MTRSSVVVRQALNGCLWDGSCIQVACFCQAGGKVAGWGTTGMQHATVTHVHNGHVGLPCHTARVLLASLLDGAAFVEHKLHTGAGAMAEVLTRPRHSDRSTCPQDYSPTSGVGHMHVADSQV